MAQINFFSLMNLLEFAHLVVSSPERKKDFVNLAE